MNTPQEERKGDSLNPIEYEIWQDLRKECMAIFGRDSLTSIQDWTLRKIAKHYANQ